jgi:hypothetical protein
MNRLTVVKGASLTFEVFFLLEGLFFAAEDTRGAQGLDISS